MFRTRLFSGLVSGALLTLGGSISLLDLAPSGYAQGSCQTFNETGKTVCGKFLTYWQQHGGLAQQGFPISAEMQEVSDTDGKTYTVQYFERAVFEAHPENTAPNDVLLSLLGVFYYKDKYPNGAPDQKTSTEAGAVKFNETGHTVGGKFLDYWKSHGGLAQQGYPISDEFSEVSDLNGKTYTVQYFERAVFELHPENQPPNDVLLSQLGTFRYKQKYQQPAVSPTAQATTPAPTAQPTAAEPTAIPTIAPQPSGETATMVLQITNDKIVTPWGLAVDGDGNIYVTSKDYVLKFDNAGKLLTSFGSTGTGDGQFNFKCYNNPSANCGAVAVDPAGNVYVADSGNSRIQKFDRDGHFLLAFGTKGQAEGQMLNPIDLAVDSQGNTYIVDDVNLGIRKYGPDGRFVATLAGGEGSVVTVSEPVGIAVDRANNVYAVDDRLNSVFKFGADGKLLLRWGRTGNQPGQFHSAVDVAADPQGNIYVAEAYSVTRVQKFGGNGAWNMLWGSYGSGPGQFSSPASIATDSQGFVYVLDSSDNRLQKFQVK